MKVLLFSQFFSTTKGGGEYVFSLLARELAKKGNKIWLITNKLKNETYPSHENIKIIFVPPEIEYAGGMPPSFGENVRYSINAILKGISIIKNEKIDIIHSNNFAPALAGSILSSLTGKPHITAIHDVFSLCGKNYWKLWGKQSNVSRINVMLAPLFEKWMIKLRLDAIHTVSEATKEDLIKLGAKKPIYVIPNSIEIENVNEEKVKPFQFVYVGRLVFYKNLEVVIRAINILKESYPLIKLIIVGDGPHRKNLENLVDSLKLFENIEFKGFVSAEEKMKELSSSQALVFPSVCEGFGIVILESFSVQKPVLVSNVRPLSDIVSDKVNGYVLSPHNETEWVSAMKNIIDSPNLSETMGMKGKELLEKNYNIEKMKNQILNMYNEIMLK